MNRGEIGRLGEAYAENFLTSQNYQVLLKNYHSRFGEIDIVTLDLNLKPAELVFVEVKTRTSTLFGEPQESVSRKKLQKTLKTVFTFFSQNKKWLTPYWRMDVIALKLDRHFKVTALEHLKNILNGN